MVLLTYVLALSLHMGMYVNTCIYMSAHVHECSLYVLL